jgi:4-hydroxy-tetrahydrodipicolinate synthase
VTSEAKEFARAHLRGIWAAALTPFDAEGRIDEAGLRRNLRHWIDDLGIDGFFMAGKQGEFFSLSMAERKRLCEIAVEETRRPGHRRAGVIMSCSDQNLDATLELLDHAEAAGAEFAVVHAPVLHFVHHQDRILEEYYAHVAARTGLGLALWSHPDSGYLMSPDLCARLADIPNVVAIKYSVPREMYVALTRLAGDRLIVSTASEEEWLDNVLELGWQVYLCSSPPYLLQTAGDRRMRDYTDLAFAGEAARARAVRDSLEPVRAALRGSRPPDKPQSQQKRWQELLGQAGGTVRRPMLELTAAERAAVDAAFAACGLMPATRETVR